MFAELLNVKNLSIKHIDGTSSKNIVSDISFSLKKNRCLGIIGESGSGKSMTCKAILGLLNKNFEIHGNVVYKDIHLLKTDKRKIRHIRGKEIAMILQNPMTAFDPLYTIESQMMDTFIENLNISKKDAYDLSLKALNDLNINHPREALKKYPHQLSGGMLQRVMIAIALSLKPGIIIADEPTTAVDSINAVKVMDEFARIKDKYNTSMIFISHDLGAIERISDDILVMKEGRVIETGETLHVLKNPSFKYTKYLIDTRQALVDKFYKAIESGGSHAIGSK